MASPPTFYCTDLMFCSPSWHLCSGAGWCCSTPTRTNTPGRTGEAQGAHSSGTRQGSMVSPDAWSCYTDYLLQRLRSLGVGCHLGGLFMGAFRSNRRAKELMLWEVERFAMDSYIHISTDPDTSQSKSKLIFVCGLLCVWPSLLLCPLYLCGGPLPSNSKATAFTWDTRSMSLVT